MAKQWERNLKQFAEAQIQKEMIKVARDIKTVAQALVPKKTGKLSRSIKSTITKKNEIAVGSTEDYAIYVELGTRNQIPQPFLRPAMEMVIRRYNKRG